MGAFLWGVVFGWAVCATYYYQQTDNNEKAAGGAVIIFLSLATIAVIFSISLGMANGTITPDGVNVTPTALGR
jgi:1,4-dihydroxy-2-naphthoate octaprenyltransferase